MDEETYLGPASSRVVRNAGNKFKHWKMSMPVTHVEHHKIKKIEKWCIKENTHFWVDPGWSGGCRGVILN